MPSTLAQWIATAAILPAEAVVIAIAGLWLAVVAVAAIRYTDRKDRP